MGEILNRIIGIKNRIIGTALFVGLWGALGGILFIWARRMGQNSEFDGGDC